MVLSAVDLQTRHAALIAVVSRDGELDVNNLDLSVSPAAIDLRVKAPGGLAGHDVSFRYFEKYVRSGTGWSLIEYIFLISWQNGPGQFEYHWHPFRWSAGQAIFHIHCQPQRGVRGYYRSVPLTLEEARTDLLRRYASGVPVDCTGLYVLDSA